MVHSKGCVFHDVAGAIEYFNDIVDTVTFLGRILFLLCCTFFALVFMRCRCGSSDVARFVKRAIGYSELGTM
jgi:hypothetical protein